MDDYSFLIVVQAQVWIFATFVVPRRLKRPSPTAIMQLALYRPYIDIHPVISWKIYGILLKSHKSPVKL